MEDILKKISTKILIGLFTLISGLISAGLYGGFKFYTEWKADEAAEDEIKYQEKALQFDTPEQKQEVKAFIKEALPPLEQRLKKIQDDEFHKKVDSYFKDKAHLDSLNADQIYQIKEQIKFIVEDYKTKH